MTVFKRAFLTSAAASILGSAVSADVAPQDVWNLWQKAMNKESTEFSADVTEEGDTLTVRNIKIISPLANDAGSVTTVATGVSFKDRGDGTVAILCPEVMTYEMTFDVKEASDAPSDATTTQEKTAPTSGAMKVEMMCSEIEVIASGDPDDIVLDFKGPRFALKLDEFDVAALDPSQTDSKINNLEIVFTNLAGQNSYKDTDDFAVETQATADEVTYVIDMVVPKEDGQMKMSAKAQDVSYSGAVSYPADLDLADMANSIGKMSIEGMFDYGASESTFDIVTANGNGPVTAQTNAASGKMSFAMKDGMMDMEGASSDVSLALTQGAPFPIETSLKEMGMIFRMPFLRSDTAQDYQVAFTLAELNVPDLLWGMFDPGQKLPREPLTVAFDFGGKAKLETDLTNGADMASDASKDNFKGEVESFQLNSLNVSAFGAELTGNGDLSFDNSKIEETGAPIPSGSIDLKLVGSNALLDNLSAAGLLPKEQVMSARMMLGLFAVQSGGEDTLTSEIEFRPTGEILANGQRIK